MGKNVEFMGTARLGLFGKELGAAGLLASEEEVVIAFFFKAHPPIRIPASQIESVGWYCLIPWIDWGIQIRHRLSGLTSPLCFGAIVNPFKMLKALSRFPWASKHWKKL